jgi:hypothetical protein
MYAMKSTGKVYPCKMAGDVQGQIKHWVHTVAWRKWKFVLEPEMKVHTDTCYDSIATKLGIDDEEEEYYMSKKEFNLIYNVFFKQTLSQKRQNTQSQLMKVFQGRCSSHVRASVQPEFGVAYP